MKHTYQITGMSCQSCINKIKNELLRIDEITQVDISLAEGTAEIEMLQHVDTSVLQTALAKAGSYTISMHSHVAEQVMEAKEKSWIATYNPLLLVVGFIVLISTITSLENGSIDWMQWMNYFMAGFFIAFSFFKFLDLKGFAMSYSSYDLIASKWKGYGYIYPFIELLLGIAYLAHWEPFVTNSVTAVVMAVSSLGVINSLLKKRSIQCACLGTVFNLPMSKVTLIEDGVMFFMAIGMLFCI
jgi:copper chaperone CopZ